jgi:hypothetical protein
LPVDLDRAGIKLWHLELNMDALDASLTMRRREMSTAQVSFFMLSSSVAAIWLALSGGVVEAGDLSPEAHRVFDEQGC